MTNEKVFFFFKIVKIQTTTEKYFCDYIWYSLEDRNLQRFLKTCYIIFFLLFYWTLNIRIRRRNVRVSWIFIV